MRAAYWLATNAGNFQSTCIVSHIAVVFQSAQLHNGFTRHFSADTQSIQQKDRHQKAPESSESSETLGAKHPNGSPQQQTIDQQAACGLSTRQDNAAAAGVSAGAGLQNFIRPELVTHVSSTINRLTGYDGIDVLKSSLSQVDEALTASKKQLQAAKLEYDQLLIQQTQLHREVTALLQRKSSWVPADVSRFTELYAAEHQTEQAVSAAKGRHSQLSDEVEQLQLKLVDLIRERYQQEQLWSDKIRRASTWWTWGLMGLHFASFVAVYTFIEPRKRQALTAAVAGMLQQHTTQLDNKLSLLARAAPTTPEEAEAAGPEAQDIMAQPGTVQRQNKQQQQGFSRPDGQQQQQQVLVELQKVQQQLQHLQQSLPQHAAAAAAAAAGASQGAQLPSGPWQQLPGSDWAKQKAISAGEAMRIGWRVTKQKGREVASHFNPFSKMSEMPQDELHNPPVKQGVHAAAVSGTDSNRSRDVGGDTATSNSPGQAALSSKQSKSDELGPSAHGQPNSIASTVSKQEQQQVPGVQQMGKPLPPPQQQQQPDAAQAASELHNTSSSSSLASVLQQWRGGSRVLEVTRGQLALLGVAASTLGAGLASVVVYVVLHAGRPGGDSAAGSS